MGIHARPLINLSLPGGFGAGDGMRAVVRMADQNGFDTFSVTDHPYNAEMYEAYAALAYLLGSTENLGAYVSVTNLPLRPAQMLARTVATLSDISGDRFVLGIGAGGFPAAINRMGVTPQTPGEAVRAFEDALRLIRELTGGGSAPVTADGAYPVHGIQPAPVATPPIWTGSQGRKSLEVTGRLADGWIPPNGTDWTSETVRKGRPIIDAAAVAAGRSPEDIGMVYKFGGALTPFEVANTRNAHGQWIGGSAGQWVEAMTEGVRDHGATGFSVTLTDETGAITGELIERFGSEVIAPLKAAVGV